MAYAVAKTAEVPALHGRCNLEATTVSMWHCLTLICSV
jgi:hypothetical protein